MCRCPVWSWSQRNSEPAGSIEIVRHLGTRPARSDRLNLSLVNIPEPAHLAPSLLPERFLRWFAARGWSPREHQLALLAKARDDRSALLIAPTGAGKTLAGFLPTLVELSAISMDRRSSASSAVRASPLPPRSGGEGSGVGGGSAGSPRAEARVDRPPTPDPSPPRAARAGGGEKEALAGGDSEAGAKTTAIAAQSSRPALISTGRGVTAQPRPAHALHLAVEGARGRYRPQSGDARCRDGSADQDRDPHRRYAGVAAAAAAALSAGHPAHHAGATGAVVVVRRRAVSVLIAQAHRARRVARAGDLQARRSVVAGAGAAVAAGAADARDRAVGHGRGAGIAGALPGAATRWPSRSRRHRGCRRRRRACRRDARHPRAIAVGRPQRAPRAGRGLRPDQAQQDHAGVRQHPQPGRDAVPGSVADER